MSLCLVRATGGVPVIGRRFYQTGTLVKAPPCLHLGSQNKQAEYRPRLRGEQRVVTASNGLLCVDLRRSGLCSSYEYYV